MPYSTLADLQHQCGGAIRLQQLTDWDGDRSPDTTTIDTAIANADRLIDSYLNKQYLVPLAAAPADIVRLSARLARFELLEARGLVDEHLTKSYETDLKWLADVRDGLISIGIDPPPAPTSMRAQDGASDRPTSKDVSRKKLHGFS